jgi:multiple sugar transport system permease protein
MAATTSPTTVPARPGAQARQARRTAGLTFAYIVLGIGLLVTLLPFVYVVLSSFKNSQEIIRVPPTLLPETWTLQNYLTIFNDPRVPLARFYANSLFVSVSRVAITLFTSSFAGFIFAKYRFRGRSVLFGLVLATLMIPFQVIMIPAYLILVSLGLIDSLWGLVIPSMVDAFGIFLMKQFIEGIPNELMDAARIDGSPEFSIYWRIILPQLGAPLAALGIFVFIATWNDFLWPLVVITTHERRTLPLLLSWYSNQYGSRPGLTLTAAVLVMFPLLIAYIFFQRWIVRGVTLTGFK